VPGSWSPNGKRIVFQRFGVFVVNINGTGLEQILPPTIQANCCTFDWSPQGNDIAFSRHATPNVHSSIWIVHRDGSGLQPLNVEPSSACGGANSDPSADGSLRPAWSPDGTKVAFPKGQDLDEDGNIYTVDVDGTGLTQVTHAGGSQSPDWARTRLRDRDGGLRPPPLPYLTHGDT
jgi:Tol biopolymer transport system component